MFQKPVTPSRAVGAVGDRKIPKFFGDLGIDGKEILHINWLDSGTTRKGLRYIRLIS